MPRKCSHFKLYPERRSGKSTHISMISNSVTHLRSYTNTTIADIAGNSAQAPILTESRYLRIECQYRCIEWRMFHDISQCFKSLSCFTSGSLCFTSGSLCFTSGSWPYWNSHGTDQAMTFGAYVHNFGALIGA